MKRTIAIAGAAGLFYVALAVGSCALSAYSLADAAQAGAPLEIASGTRLLIGLQDSLSTKTAKAGDRFSARTLEPLTITDGSVLPPGAQVRGHVDKVEAAHRTGRARMWLTFDDLQLRSGRAPLVAAIDDVPGVQSVRVNFAREGDIEGNSEPRRTAYEAAAAGALAGAAPGVAAHNNKDAATGAAMGAVTAFMVTSGLGQELALEKGTKLEITLERSLYLAQN
ncbi:MAG TPA: hypothetical protein VIY66_14985 [Candidatus Acidoferrales bacterium]